MSRFNFFKLQYIFKTTDSPPPNSMSRISCLIFCFSCFNWCCLVAQNTINLDGETHPVLLFDQIEFAVEKGCLPFDANRLATLKFSPDVYNNYYASIKNKSLWGRISLNNTSSQTISYVLSIQNSYLRQGDVYLMTKGNVVQLPSFSSFAKVKSQLFYNLPHWYISLPPKKTTIYIRLYDTIKRTRIYTLLKTHAQFVNDRFQYLQLNAAYLFFNCAVWIIGLVLILRTKQYYFLFYIGYLMLFVLEFFAVKGLFFPFFLKHFPFFSDNFRVLNNALSTVLVTLFFREFYYWMGGINP